MSWDSEFFLPQNGVLTSESGINKKDKLENKFVRCAQCNELISVVSATIYEIDDKHYCSECYSRKIINLAVERDHFDLKEEKTPLQK